MHEQDGVSGAIGVSDDETAAETTRGSLWPRHGATSARKPDERQSQAALGVPKGVLPRGLRRNRGTEEARQLGPKVGTHLQPRGNEGIRPEQGAP